MEEAREEGDQRRGAMRRDIYVALCGVVTVGRTRSPLEKKRSFVNNSMPATVV